VVGVGLPCPTAGLAVHVEGVTQVGLGVVDALSQARATTLPWHPTGWLTA